MIWAKISYKSGEDKNTIEFKVKTQNELMEKVIESGIHPNNFLTCLISRGKGFSQIPRERFNEWFYQTQGGD